MTWGASKLASVECSVDVSGEGIEDVEAEDLGCPLARQVRVVGFAKVGGGVVGVPEVVGSRKEATWGVGFGSVAVRCPCVLVSEFVRGEGIAGGGVTAKEERVCDGAKATEVVKGHG